MSTNLSIVPRDHFHRDPIFQDCWNALQEERQALARRSFYSEESGSHDVPIPWKWNTVAKMKEFFVEPPKFEKSCEVDTSKYQYKILLDVQHFEPENLTITLTNRTIVIKGYHEEKGDLLGAVSRQFTRKYILPADVVMDRIECHLSADGVLHINAPRAFTGQKIRPDEDDEESHKDAIKHSFPSQQSEVDKPSTITEVNGTDNFIDVESNCSIEATPDFDMVPFWARDSPKRSQFGIKTNLDYFMVVIDVEQFKPEEVNVYTTRHYVKVEGKHDERQDPHGFVTRSFTRKYWIPAGVKPENLSCSLSNTGVLEIMAPMPKQSLDIEKHVRLPIVLVEEAKVQKWYDPELI